MFNRFLIVFLLATASQPIYAAAPNLVLTGGIVNRAIGVAGVGNFLSSGYIDIPGACHTAYMNSSIETPALQDCSRFNRDQIDLKRSCLARASASKASNLISNETECITRLFREKRACEVEGNIFSISGSAIGSCDAPMACPNNSSPFEAGSCKCDVSGLVFSANIGNQETCGSPESLVVDCSQEPIPGVDEDSVIALYEENCPSQAELDKERAVAEAQAQARADLDKQASEASAKMVSDCNSAVANFTSNCNSVSATAPPSPPNFQNIESQAKCEHIRTSSSSIISQNIEQIESCISQYNGLSSSCSTSSSETLTGSGTASVNGQTASVPGDGEAPTGHASAPQNLASLGQASKTLEDLNDRSTELNEAMSKLNQDAQKCVQAFQQDQDNATYTPTNIAGMGSAFNNSLAGSRGSFKAGLGELSRGIGKVANAFNEYNNSYGGSRGTASFGDFNKVRPSVGASDTYDKPYMGDAESTNSESNNGGDSSLAAMSGNGGSYGRGSRGSAPSGLSGSNDAAPKKRRAFKSAKSRNRILGYKKVKGSSGSASFAIKPSDYRRLGKAQIQKALADARKKFGKDKPLKFDGKKFVLDFLAMKESERFKRSQDQAQRFWAGTSRSEQPKLYVHENPNLNIFKLLSFRYGRQTLNEDPVKRSTASSIR